MTSIEIRYLVPEFSKNETDFEMIVNAVGAYEIEAEKLQLGLQQTAELEQSANDSVMIKLIRATLNAIEYSEALLIAEEMKTGVESFFPDDHQSRLIGRFVASKIEQNHSWLFYKTVHNSY